MKSVVAAIDRMAQTWWNYIGAFIGDTSVSVFFAICAFWAGPAWLAVAGIVGGWAFYTLLEWLVHNYAYHKVKGRPHELHMLHHRKPNLPLALPFFTTPLLALVLTLLIPGATTVAVVAGWLSGMWAGFVYYGFFHHFGHLKRFRKWPFGKLWTHHLMHHAQNDCNYGVTTTLWDRVFGTYRAVPERRRRRSGNDGERREPRESAA